MTRRIPGAFALLLAPAVVVFLLSRGVDLLWAIFLLIAIAPLLLGRLSILDYIVVGAPFMTYVAGLHVALSDAFLPLAAIVVLAGIRQHPPPVRALERRIALFLLAALVSITASAALASSRDSGFSLDLALTDAMKLSVVLAYCAIVALLVAREPLSRVFFTLRLWTWVAALLSIGSALTQFAGIPLVPAGSARSFGFFQDPNLYAGYLLVSLSIVLACESYESRRVTPYLIVALTAGIASTASRSGLATLALMFALAFFVVGAKRVRRTLAVAGVGGLWFAFALYSGNAKLLVFPALQRLVTASAETGSDPRLALWARAIELWSENSLTGIGIGQYVRFSGDVYGISGRTGTGFVAHNTFLTFLTEQGLLGLTVCAFGLYAVAKTGAALRNTNKNVRWSLHLGLVAIMAQMMTLNLQNIRYVWIFFGLVLGMAATTSIRPPFDPTTRSSGATEHARTRPSITRRNTLQP